MEVVRATPNGGGGSLPFRTRDVHEWSHLDSITGVLERARRETDHWAANTSTSSHNYNKVVDSRARSQVDGVQVEARKFEVFQSNVPGSHLQVVKSHTVTSSRFSKPTSNGLNSPTPHFADLELALHPLDLSFEKSKVSVGRSVGRRPPSRPRIREESSLGNHRVDTHLHRVSRLCHQIHENAVKKAFGHGKLPIHERENGDGVEIEELETSEERAKSTSSEDLHAPEKEKRKSVEDLEDLEQLRSWRRSSKIRRSLQLPKAHISPPVKLADLPDNKGSVRRIREDLETGRRLNTALRGNNVDLKALDEILQSISNSSSDAKSDSDYGTTRKPKRNSFVTVESLKEVRDRLRRTSPEEVPQKPFEDTDDGIVTDPVIKSRNSPPKEISQSRVRSYVYGLETTMKKPGMGTGSLESRSKQLNGNCTFRGEDWYNRRKSYGFERVHNTEEPVNISRNTIESSTDSGICRSSEGIVPANSKSLGGGNVQKFTSMFEGRSNPDGFGATTVTIPITSPFEENLNEKLRRTNLSDSENDPWSQGRKQKRVEFCKTEVHFAAESGKVNIVATDEKPPPTNNFRRRRKHHNQIVKNMNKTGMPVLHFGDSSYEKSLFAINDTENDTEPNHEEDTPCSNTVTVSTNQTFPDYTKTEDFKEMENEIRKGILKNKPIKPKPYLLGEENFFKPQMESEDIWGVRLKPVQEPMWKSTVTLKNTLYEKKNDYETNLSKSIRRNVDRNENRGYSTKVNIGGDEDVVVDYEKHSSPWITLEESPKDAKKHVLNKGLIVRIGRDDTNSQHTLYSKTTMNNTTTTKITIDLSPSPNRTQIGLSRLPSSQNFKSTSLILNTFKREDDKRTCEDSKSVSQQLEVLKKLYEDWQSDTEADKEVQSLMNIQNNPVDDSSIISGSWSKMRALRTMQQQLTKNITSSYFNSHARVEKDFCLSRIPEPTENIYAEIREKTKDTVNSQYRNELSSPFLVQNRHKISPMRSPSPRKQSPSLSKSPRLINKELNSSWSKSDSKHLIPSSKSLSSSPRHLSPNLRIKNAITSSSNPRRTSSISSPRESRRDQLTESFRRKMRTPEEIKEHKTIRIPKKSEMAYFGVKNTPSPRPVRRECAKYKSKEESTYATLEKRVQSPIYENIEEFRLKEDKKEFDSSILDELTKAADQILQAVNNYAQEDSNYKTSDEEEQAKLETISETKSWKYSKQTNQKSISSKKLKQTSSNSSLESTDRLRQIRRNSLENDKKKKSGSDSSSIRAATKARRLQRASSREALLQSHGSSSEDLPVKVEIASRKPRIMKKTKVTQLTVTNGPEYKKSPRNEKGKSEERVPVAALPEIRHKTAVSTIRSTAEKNRDRLRSRNEEEKKSIIKRLPVIGNSEKIRSVTKKEPISHRIATAYVPAIRPKQRKNEINSCPCV